MDPQPLGDGGGDDVAPTRVCQRCLKAKSINGVWYLVATEEPACFVCGACYSLVQELNAPLVV